LFDKTPAKRTSNEIENPIDGEDEGGGEKAINEAEVNIKASFPKQVMHKDNEYTKKEVLFNRTKHLWYCVYRCSKYRGCHGKNKHECKAGITIQLLLLNNFVTIEKVIKIKIFF